MAIAIKSLADGQLPNVKTQLYTCPASTTAIVRLITLVNTGAAARTVNLYLKPSGGTSRRLIPQNMSIAIGNLANVDQIMTLEAGDVIEGDASVAAEVDYTIGGVEKTSAIAAGQFNISAGTTSNNLLAVTFANAGGVSFGLNGSVVTAVAPGGSPNVSAGTTSGNLASMVFSNSNGVTFGLNGSTVTGSVVAGLTNINVSAGTTSNNLSAVTFSNSNGVTFGLNGSVITASVNTGGGAGATISSYQNVNPYVLMTWQSNSTSHAVAFVLPENGSFSFLRVPVLNTQNSTGMTTVASSADMSALRAYTFQGVVYSMGTGASSQSLMSVTSASCAYAILNSVSLAANGTEGSYTQAITWHQEGVSSTSSTQYSASSSVIRFSSGFFTGFTAGRLLDLDFAASLTPGPYWLVAGMSSTTLANTDAQSNRISGAIAAGAYYSCHFGVSQLNSAFRRFGESNAPAYLGGGVFSTAGGGTVANLPISAISTSASNNQMMFQLLRSA